MRISFILLALVLLYRPASATDCSTYAPHAPTDYSDEYPPQQLDATRPAYLMPQYLDMRLRAVITRITADSGAVVAHSSSSMWGGDGRHQYSVRPAWNATQSLIYIENGTCNDCAAFAFCPNTSTHGYNGPATPTRVLLDGNTYVPLSLGQSTPLMNPYYREVNWHPSLADSDIMIALWDTTAQNYIPSRLDWINVRTGAVPRSWTLPFKASGIGPGEGSPSNDGRYIALSSTVGDTVYAIDMEAYPTTSVIGPYVLDPCGLCGTDPCAIDGSGHVSV